MTRRLVFGALVTLVLGGLLSVGQLQAAQPAFAAGTPSCSARQLVERLSNDTQDVTQRYRFIVLTNTGGRCALRGRPAMSLEFRSRAVGVRGEYFPYSPTGGRPRVRSVTLAHRAVASIWLAVAVAGTAKCPRQQVDGFLVRLPHQHAQQVRLPVAQQRRYAVCASRTSHELAFSQFLSGSGHTG